MIREILFATHNVNKLNEVRQLLPSNISLLSLSDINWTLDIPEPFQTFDDNAKAKAYFVFEKTGLRCFADDSGLEIEALDGRPGVLSARYAGEQKESDDNIDKVLAELGNEKNRNARFHAVIAYIVDESGIELFRGTVKGKINYTSEGRGGFGYDPIFIPDGFGKTFGQLDESLKNKISHRAIAMQKFVEYLERVNRSK